ncbi:hypothetical protein [Melaminivora sp.]|uniref:hypothetical protein n=1 Tax=Melaminivora sp. TaxID=1933032 RepID=UPI0028B0AA98|nr:hypothetical protein [Melaminivora sp.]
MTSRPLPPACPLLLRAAAPARAAPLPPFASLCLAALAGCLLAAPPARAALAGEGLAAQAGVALAEEAQGPARQAVQAPYTLRSEDAAAFIDLPGAGTTARQDGGALRYTDVTGWLTPGRASSLGLTLGLVSAQPGDGAAAAPGALAYDLGMRWRLRMDARKHLDVQAWTRQSQFSATPQALSMVWSHSPAAVGARMEVQWKASRTGGLIPEFGAVGVQLQGDAKLLLRARRGGPMVYYRAKF